MSTVGKHPEEVPKDLVRFLEFVHAGLENSEKDWEDEYIRSLQNRVARIKASREMGGMYMRIIEAFGEEYLEDLEEAKVVARAEGREEGLAKGRTEGQLEQQRRQIIQWVSKKGEMSAELKRRIEQETDSGILDSWSVYAVLCTDTEDFIRKISLK